MLKEYEASGKTLDEAIDMVCLRAGRTIDELNIEVIDMPSKGIFGIGHRDARVRATFEAPDELVVPVAEPPKPSTFGQKRSKQERIEKKKAQVQQELEIKPIVAIDPSAVTEELREQVRNSTPVKPRPERPQYDRPERRERPERAERPQYDRPERRERPQYDRPERPERTDRPQYDRPERREQPEQGERPERPANQSRPRPENGGQQRPRPERNHQGQNNGQRPRGERPSQEQDAEARSRAAARRESRATPITEGEMAETITAACCEFLQPVFAKLRIEPAMQTEIKEGALWICFSGESLGLLIGRRGETLNALQYLTNLVINKNRNDHIRVVLDVEGYREGREETLTALAHKMAEKAVRTGRRIELEPMNPHERRVVHLALQNDKRVDTISHGEEPYRRVVISKKGSNYRHRRRGKGNGGNRPANQNAPQQEQAPVEHNPASAPAASAE